MSASLEPVRLALGGGRAPKAPTRIVQEQFDGNDAALARLCSDLTEPPDEVDLVDYALDLHYVELQRDLFAFVFPRCLEAWRGSLFAGTTTFVEHFHAALTSRGLLTEYLSPTQRDAVFEFMRESIVERIDREKRLSFTGSGASPYTWIDFFGSFGVLVPQVDRLWTNWWTLSTPGRCVAALQYASCLMYPDDQNPIFAPWTRGGGGGPPLVWDTASLGFGERWIDRNVAFLTGTLTADWLENRVRAAAAGARGLGEAEVADQMVADCPGCRNRVNARIPQLIERLGTPSAPGGPWKWAPGPSE